MHKYDSNQFDKCKISNSVQLLRLFCKKCKSGAQFNYLKKTFIVSIL